METCVLSILHVQSNTCITAKRRKKKTPDGTSPGPRGNMCRPVHHAHQATCKRVMHKHQADLADAKQHNTTPHAIVAPCTASQKAAKEAISKKPIIPPRPPLFSHPAEMKPLHNPVKSLHPSAKTARLEQTQPARPSTLDPPQSNNPTFPLTVNSLPLHFPFTRAGPLPAAKKYCRPKKTFRRSRTHRPPRKSSIKEPSAAHSFELFFLSSSCRQYFSKHTPNCSLFHYRNNTHSDNLCRRIISIVFDLLLVS